MPMPMGAMGGGGLPKPGASPLPGSLAGGPPGPGASPIGPAGAGPGNEMMADSIVKAMIPGLHKALAAYQIGSKKYSAVLNAIRALTANFGKEQQSSMVPAALLQLAQASRGANPLPSTPPPGIAPRTPSPQDAVPGAEPSPAL